jgi:hypothetical protein
MKSYKNLFDKEYYMKIATKALLAVLIVTAFTLQTVPVSAASRSFSGRMGRQVERVQQHHDRKMELRAAVLGITADELRQELKQKSFEKILKEHGFSTKESFLVALQGKIKDELKHRGLSDEQIGKILLKREHRAETM